MAMGPKIPDVITLLCKVAQLKMLVTPTVRKVHQQSIIDYYWLFKHKCKNVGFLK